MATGYGYFWMGQPVDKMTRDELIAALINAAEQLRAAQFSAISDIRSMRAALTPSRVPDGGRG